MNEDVEIKRYGIMAYGTEENVSGNYLKVDDVITLLEYILDDDDFCIGRLSRFEDFLKGVE